MTPLNINETEILVGKRERERVVYDRKADQVGIKQRLQQKKEKRERERESMRQEGRLSEMWKIREI